MYDGCSRGAGTDPTMPVRAPVRTTSAFNARITHSRTEEPDDTRPVTNSLRRVVLA
jgi:hypothetical protein